MQSERIRPLNDRLISGGNCVMYVMSRDQRVHDNHALLAAQQTALEHHVPLVVVYNLRTNVGLRRYEHYAFMADGLLEVQKTLAHLAIGFVVLVGDATTNLKKFAAEHKPIATYFDFSPLASPRQIQKVHAESASEPCFVVDTHNIVPVWIASDKQEFAAHTFRPKIHRLLATYLIEPEKPIAHPYTFVGSHSTETAKKLLHGAIRDIPKSGIEVQYVPGEAASVALLDSFIPTLASYAKGRNDIAHDQQSGLSPYLHFGHIASLRVALTAMQATKHAPQLFTEARMPQAGDIPTAEDGMNALLEEMIVRKELSDNFCYYGVSYKTIEAAPEWARRTLQEHQADAREFVYSLQEWEQASTHDKAWNAAQKQLLATGKIHGYMRMYWAKKILEWSESPQQALQTALYLNDTYSIDGGDPNGYVGVLWSIAGLHDRAWTRRPVYGTIRYMNEGGLRRKFDLDAYIAQWE